MSRRIIKYSNRRLYDPVQKRVITLLALSDLLAGGVTVTVEEKESGEDITAVTVLQSVLERLKRCPVGSLDRGGRERLLDIVRGAIERHANRAGEFERAVSEISAGVGD